MRLSESLWIGQKILKIAEETLDFRLLNVGSSTKKFRENEQPWVHNNIFNPIRNLGSVDHLDLKDTEGVDIVGDLTDPAFLELLKLNSYDMVLCSNLLEHVVNPEEICIGIEECVKEEGLILVTVPYLYPYHNDPIDTKFRPDIEILTSYFKNSTLVEGEILIIEDNHFKTLLRNKKLLVQTIIRWGTPFYKYETWKKIISDIPNTFTPFKITCVLLVKDSVENIE